LSQANALCGQSAKRTGALRSLPLRAGIIIKAPPCTPLAKAGYEVNLISKGSGAASLSSAKGREGHPLKGHATF